MRNQIGENNNNAHITKEQASIVKGLAIKGARQYQIMHEVGLTRANVWAILHGMSWKDVTPDLTVILKPTLLQQGFKRCPRCKIDKELKYFTPRKLSLCGRDSYCKECKNEIVRISRKRDRLQTIQRLGGKCVCCGENCPEFLAFDHEDGGGNKERKLLTSAKIMKLIYQGKYNKKIRILCHNCNMAIGFYGYCPHSKEK